jgi:hypothetical protein
MRGHKLAPVRNEKRRDDDQRNDRIKPPIQRAITVQPRQRSRKRRFPGRSDFLLFQRVREIFTQRFESNG